MEQDALVFPGDVERGADLFRAAALDVAHVDDGALLGRQRRDRGPERVERFPSMERVAGKPLPVGGEDLPATRIAVVGPAKAARIDRRLAGVKRRERK